jgi:predicted ATPase/signal transduction histidine kinase/GAF domain-containing protein
MSQIPISKGDRFPLINGYQLNQQIHAGNRTVVYRGIRLVDGLPVVLKTLRSDRPTPQDLLRLRNHYAIAKKLNFTGIVQPIALEAYGNGLVLVMPDDGYIALSDYIETNPLSQIEIVAIAIQLATILDELNPQRAIHKDIKPSNILIDPSTKQIKVTDFGLATLLPHETQTLVSANVLEGTLAYMAPEQTGRMNRGIDYRSDFYTLGVTLFELLTGQLPFQSDDPLELVYAHLAKPPTPPHEIVATLPLVLSDIVLKLMAKNAEDRYQSATGLRADLQRCLEDLLNTGTIHHFSIGQVDDLAQFNIPQKLYGREPQVQALRSAFERIGQGSCELVLVSGYSGIGKTSLIKELLRSLTHQKGYFIAGKFDQFKRDVPLDAPMQAWRELIRQLLTESQAQLQYWRAALLKALGLNGQVIIEIIPELALIIGEHPPVPDLGASEARNRTIQTFHQFNQVFQSPDHPVVFFMDDGQWADITSCQSLQAFMQNPDNHHWLMIVAYRDNEVSPTHPLIQSVEAIRQAGTTITEINLKPLGLVEVAQLIADTLHTSAEFVAPLAELLFQKTAGNPFFLTQLLESLHENGSIWFDDTSITQSLWQWDLAQIQRRDITDNVVELMISKISKLALPTQQILQLAACIGNAFDLQTLATVSERSLIDVAQDLWKAIQTGLIAPIGEWYRLPQMLSADEVDQVEAVLAQGEAIAYQFLHDRIQQAAYSLIPLEQKQATHIKIGRLMLANTSDRKQEERAFEITNQLNRGVELVVDPLEQIHLAQLNLIASRKAKAANAYEASLEYANTGIALLADDSWHDHYKLTLHLYKIAIEAAYLTGEFSQMETLAKMVMQQVKTTLDQIKVVEVMIQGYAAQNRHLEAIALALDTLEKLGVSLPTAPTPQQIQQEFLHVQEVVSNHSIEELRNLPVMNDPHKLAASRILANMSGITSIAVPTLIPITVLCHVKISIEYGNSPFSAHGYIGYGILVSLVLQDSQTAYQFGQLALQLIERAKNKVIHTKIFQLVGAYTIHWEHHVSETLPFFDCACTSGLEDGDLEFLGYALMTKCQYRYFLGRELTELDREIAAYNDNLAKLKQEASLSRNQILRQSVLNLIVPNNNPCNLTGNLLQEEEFVRQHILANDKLGLHYFYSHKLILCNLFGVYTQGLENSKQAQLYLDGADGFLNVPIFHFHDSLARLQNWMLLTDVQRTEFLAAIDSNQQKMQIWAENAPMNYQHKFDLVEAEKHRVLSQYLEAMEFYDRAIAGAKNNGYLQEEALANELAARFYLELGKEKFAQIYITEAYYCYVRWGAIAKVADLEKRYPQLLNSVIEQSSSSFSQKTSNTSSSNNTESLDLATLIKASQAISEEIELDKLLAVLLSIVIANAGAEKCVLLLNIEQELQIAAIGLSGQQPQIFRSPIPLARSAEVMISLVNIVKRNLEPLVMSDARESSQFVGDRYFESHQPRSILCSPIVKQGQLLGILYLENNLTVGAFTRDRMELLKLLSAQIAISLENARLYQQSQSYARQLEESLEDLRISKSQFQKVSDNIPGVIYQICINPEDGSSFMPYINSGCYELYEVNPEAILSGQYSLRDFEHPEDSARIEQEIQHSAANLAPFRLEFRIITASGKVKWVQVESQPERQVNGAILWDGVLMDISDRKATEVQLQRQAQQLEEYSQTLEQKVEERTQDLSHTLAELQATQAELIQSEKMAVLGQLTTSIAHEINTPLGVIRAAASNMMSAFQNSLQKLPDLLQRLSPQQKEEFLGLVNGALQNQQQLLSTKEERQLRRQFETTLTSDRIANSHNIAMQLTLLRIGQDVRPYQSLLKDPNCYEILQVAYNMVLQYQSTNNIQQEVDRAAKIVFALKTYSHQSQTEEKSLVQISDGIEVALTLYHNRLKQGIEVIRNYEAVPPLLCDPDALIQVWVNLIDNAIYAIGVQGILEVSVTQRANRAIVEITDSGCGITVEGQAKIFEPFVTTKPRGEGSGLGLDIVRRIVQKHDGEIQVQSQTGRTTFAVMLPLPRSMEEADVK